MQKSDLKDKWNERTNLKSQELGTGSLLSDWKF